jgi:hypothetical protein
MIAFSLVKKVWLILVFPVTIDKTAAALSVHKQNTFPYLVSVLASP